MASLGRLERRAPRDAWTHEAHDFTPWLLANASVLGEALGMDLELHEAEHSVGNFSLDLIGLDVATGESVIVENQLARSDHGHLGQLLTYAGGTDATNIVWIADGFRPEHRAALDWLNKRTDDQTRFFAVQVSAVRIGDSPYAPLFEVIVQPNDWQKEVRAVSAQAPRTARQEAYREFWGLVLELLHDQAPGWTNAKTPLAQNWMNLPAGTQYATYSMVFTKTGPRVEVYLGARDAEVNEANLARVRTHQARIEQIFGHALDWDPLDGKIAARISYTRPGDFDQRDTWDTYAQWLVTHSIRLREAMNAAGGLAQIVTGQGDES